ncbi:MAG: Adaptive-response sensory-kinase SasA [Steroidobacteraceae bacterium]|nr:Adaptive-response sensory-kinase SasA [Steroidobacteraceae bacterium]
MQGTPGPMVVGAASYAAAAIAFVVLTFLLATSWRGRAQGVRLIAASAMTAIWAAVLALQAWRGGLPAIVVYTLEVLRSAAWIAALLALAHGVLPRFVGLAAHTIWIVLLAAGWLFAAALGRLLALAGIVLALVVLVLIEQNYRNANASGREDFKFLAIGLGGVFAFDLFLYSQSELLRGIPADVWSVRGIVNALLVPLIAIAARRNPQWSLDVFVSRQAVVFTTVIMAVGVYLLLMSAGGYWLREAGGHWGTAANVIFFTLALAVLAVMLLSGTMRRRLRVFVSKHFYRNKYDYRIEWLRFIETLSAGGGEDSRRTSLRAMAEIFESPGAIMYTRSDTAAEYVPVAAWPMELAQVGAQRGVPVDHELVRFLAARQWVIDLKEYDAAPDLYQNVSLPAGLRSAPAIRVLLPLLRPEGLAGFVLLYDPPPPFELTYEDRDLLKTIGRQVATIVVQHDADRRLAESRQFEAYHRLTAFMMHDLKNAVAQLQLIVRNAEKHRQNPAFVDDTIATIGNAAERMTRLIEQLRDRDKAPVAQALDLAALVRAAASRCADRSPAARLDGIAEPVTVHADADRLTTALEHVIRNAQDACEPSNSIVVSLSNDGVRACLTIADTGRGMEPDFVRTRLFRPFDSTKGSKGMGIGAFQVREYVRSLGGDVEVQSSPGSGTRFDIILPVFDHRHA